jgi:hypothetical protein
MKSLAERQHPRETSADIESGATIKPVIVFE